MIETLVGLALAAGVAGIILVVRALVSRVRFTTPGVRVYTVLRCEGEADGLEGTLRDARGRTGDVYILDAGLSEEGVRRARLLALRFGASFTDEQAFTEELRSVHGRD